jgi:hypothetical protein
VRHLRQKFGDSIDVILTTSTRGYFHDSPPLTLDQEVQKLRWYFLEYLKLPVTAIGIEKPLLSGFPMDIGPLGTRKAKTDPYWNGSRSSGRFKLPKELGYGSLVTDKSGKLVRSRVGTSHQLDFIVGRAPTLMAADGCGRSYRFRWSVQMDGNHCSGGRVKPTVLGDRVDAVSKLC